MVPVWLIYTITAAIVILITVSKDDDSQVKFIATIVLSITQAVLILLMHIQLEYLFKKCVDNNVTLSEKFNNDILDYKAEKYRKSLEKIDTY